MKLYYKLYNEEAVPIPEDAIIINDEDLETIKQIGDYPVSYCWEVDILRKIFENADGYFDFSKTMIDVGAGLGEYCWILPFNHAHAFDPSRKMLAKLAANAVMHDRIDNITIHHNFVSDGVYEVDFNGWNAVNDTKEQNMYSEPIKKMTTTTIDSFNIDNVGFIKIDVEGVEEQVIRGAIGTIIRSNYPPILFESFDVGQWGQTQEHRDSLMNLLKSLGYEILEYWGDYETHLAIHKN